MKAMLLAAGEGTRFRPHTLKVPKPALPFLNVPLGFYSVATLQELGIKDFVINTFHLPEKIVSGFETLRPGLKSLNFSLEENLLGSGGGLWQARDHFSLEKDFVLMNADEIILPRKEDEIRKALEKHRREEALSTLVVMDHPEVGTKFGGVWVNNREQVIGFGKTRPAEAVHGYHFIGLQFLSKNIFSYLPEGGSNILLNGVLEGIQAQEKVQVHKIDCDWFETGNLSDYLKATETCLRLLQKKSSPFLSSVLKQFAPHSQLKSNSQGLFLIDSSAQADLGQLHGFAVVGAKAKIHSHCKIENSILSENTLVSTDITNELIL